MAGVAFTHSLSLSNNPQPLLQLLQLGGDREAPVINHIPQAATWIFANLNSRDQKPIKRNSLTLLHFRKYLQHHRS